ncbi:MAG: type IV pilus modification PilV family protein [Thermoguttaceae bacterium]
MKRSRRSAFSLLEVMLATTVLLGSVIVLAHLAFVGTAHMDAARQYCAAQLACQAKMNEMLAGATPLEEVSGQAIRELPGWGLTVKIRSAGQPGLMAIEVTAEEHPAGAAQAGSISAQSGPAETDLAESDLADGAPEETDLVEDELLDSVPAGSTGVATESPGATGLVENTGKRFTLVRWIAQEQDTERGGFEPAGGAVPVDVPQERSLFDDTLPAVISPLPEEPLPAGEPAAEDESQSLFGPLPDGPGMLGEPWPAEPSPFDMPGPER